MDWKRIGSGLWEFLSLSLLSLVIGIGVGFYQGELSTGSQLGDIRMVLPNEGALTGGLFALPVGWLSYYGFLNSTVSFTLFRTIMGALVLLSTIVGLAVGYLTNGEAAFASSIMMVLLSLITIGILAAKSRETGTHSQPANPKN